jgi:hypothetical protein
MVEANKGKDNWANQIDKSTRKRKHKKAFGGQVNWQEKRAKKRAKKQEMESGAPIEPYKIDTFVIGSEKFNEYYTRLFKDVIKSEDEFKHFLQTLYDKLPVTFRLNSGAASFSRVSQMLKDP